MASNVKSQYQHPQITKTFAITLPPFRGRGTEGHLHSEQEK